MADEKQPPQPPIRRPTGAAPAPEEQGATPTQEIPPLRVGGSIQWGNLPFWGKLAGGAVVAFLTVVWPYIQHWRISKAEDDAKIADIKAKAADDRARQAKSATEGTYQVVTKPKLEELEERVHVLEVAAARAAKTPGHRTQRPIPVVVAPKPAPLPRDTNAAEAILKAQQAAVTPPPPRAVDAGP